MPLSKPSRVALAHAALVAAALLFGATFVVVKEALAELPPHAFIGWRFALGAAALLLFGLAPKRWAGGLPRGRRIWRDGVIAGSLLWLGYVFQTVGLETTTASHSALITGLYVVLTPLFAAAVARKRPRAAIVFGCSVAFVGLALLAAPKELVPNVGDLLTLGCAVAFAGHVVVLAHRSRAHAVVPFTAVQLLITCVASLILSAVLEGLPWPTTAVLPALALTGLAASAGAFLCQVWAQSVVGPARTVLLLSLETVFGALLGWWFLGERLGKLGWAGGLLILLGIYLVLAVTSHDEDLPEAEASTAAH